MTGKIIKAIAGFYYVHTESGKVYACRARGLFRKEGVKPLVGDNVRIEVLSEGSEGESGAAGAVRYGHDKEEADASGYEQKSMDSTGTGRSADLTGGAEGSVVALLPRKNALIRPAVANIDQALVVFAVREPDPNLNLLDRFLITMERQGIPVVICFSKTDLDQDGLLQHDKAIYESAGYQVIGCSAGSETGLFEVRAALLKKTTVLAGPSGVGKSSLTNLIHGSAHMEVGALSRKIRRGKQTTRHTELIALDMPDTYLLDTPGFTSLALPGLKPEDVKDYFPEFVRPGLRCRFSGCMHISEPEDGCVVKQAVREGLIFRERYETYLQIVKEQKELMRK